MRRVYQQRRAALVEAMGRQMAGLVTVSADAGGMHLSVRLDAPVNDVAVSDAAREQGLLVSPLSIFCLRAEDAARYNGFLLGYAEIAPQHADALVARLADIIRRLM
jgi:GntR family transcriptional regulator/MocR family aminotransferase